MANGFNVDAQWVQSQFADLRNLVPLGAGGFKRVFAGTHCTEGEIVLKLIHPQQSLETTRREILAVNQVGSPRVPQILAVGQITTPIGDLVWFREPRIMGETVREQLSRGPLDKRHSLRLGLHVLETLVSAEGAGIVHRDVKPDNIICDGNIDFWLLARSSTSNRRATGLGIL